MATRYDSSEILRDDKGRRFFESTLYPTIEANQNDIYIRTKVGDRLDLLANRFYGDVKLWWIIAQANHVGNGSLALDSGIQLRIPQDVSKVFSDLDLSQTER